MSLSSFSPAAVLTSPRRCVIVELEGTLAERVTGRLRTSAIDVTSCSAAHVVERFIAEPPDVALINLNLTHGSGFGLINRILRMEALAGLQIVLVAEDSSKDVLDAHAEGATPAAAYLRKEVGMTREEFAESIVVAAQRLMGDVAPDPLAATITELGYRVLRRLRDEDGGAVFACMDDELQRPVAVKLMRPDATSNADKDKERLLRFQRERRILALLRSPHIITVFGAGAIKGTPYLVRELIDGESLAEQIVREGPLDVPTALQRARETALGLKHAAGVGVIHRDVRPHNIHVVDGHAKIARFGTGKRDSPDEARITQAGAQAQLGDTTYVAPERVRGQEDLRGDIYALGVTLHTLIAGKPPFAKAAPLNPLTGAWMEAPVALDVARPGVASNVVALVARMMAEDPATRPQSYDEVLQLLDDAAKSTGGPGAVDVAEPTAVLGTLRLMNVFEIVQSLELARKSATVTLVPPRGDATTQGEGKLAFELGRLVHASVGALRGDEAFYALAHRNRGAFRVQYEPFTIEPNVMTPTTGLLLEAARREDTARARGLGGTSTALDAAFLAPDASAVRAPSNAGSLPPLRAAPREAAPTTGTHLRQIPDEDVICLGEPMAPLAPLAPLASVGAADKLDALAPITRDEHSESSLDPALLAAALPPRQVATVWGIAIIVVVALAAGIAATQIPDEVTAEVASALGIDVPAAANNAQGDVEHAANQALTRLLEETRADLRDARAQLASVAPRLQALEMEQATRASASADARERATSMKAALETLLQTDIGARRVQLRVSAEGDETVIELGEGALFTGDGEHITGDGKALLARITGALTPLGEVAVRVEGHTDDAEPRGKHKNNWGVSGARASSTAKALIEQGVAAGRVKVSALADTKPLVANKGAKGRARNRRIEIHVHSSARAAGDNP